ncbi:hypothetical protein D187_002291 [Cystobacter fuscus DSM 2262]|uniref:Uncharacterized protein n=1 Tax=Cystobacter fuscus (strain ATCC 25194 / DSM 2262 / NBRC 100088 / M29) TaxID=1242864 RepID=S9P6Y5_CYSF2|nr:hypothetical protein D187_002291 [Cystobacter fuscus DSM 2262]
MSRRGQLRLNPLTCGEQTQQARNDEFRRPTHETSGTTGT